MEVARDVDCGAVSWGLPKHLALYPLRHLLWPVGLVSMKESEDVKLVIEHIKGECLLVHLRLKELDWEFCFSGKPG
jgi:hypothetical protein